VTRDDLRALVVGMAHDLAEPLLGFLKLPFHI
jgi:hypothetical protein